jgi:FtsH-binding integral membrane protein
MKTHTSRAGLAAAGGIVLGFVVLLVVGIWTDSISRSDTAIFAALFGAVIASIVPLLVQSSRRSKCTRP